MWDIIGVIIAGVALLYTVYYVRRITKTLDIVDDPERLNTVIGDIVTQFKMSLMGKQSGYIKRKTKMQSLMQDFVVEELAPDMVEGMIPGVPPVMVKWLASKLNDSELGDYLRENPEMFPDALSMAGGLISSFMETQAAQQLDKPQTPESTGWG